MHLIDKLDFLLCGSCILESLMASNAFERDGDLSYGDGSADSWKTVRMYTNL